MNRPCEYPVLIFWVNTILARLPGWYLAEDAVQMLLRLGLGKSIDNHVQAYGNTFTGHCT